MIPGSWHRASNMDGWILEMGPLTKPANPTAREGPFLGQDFHGQLYINKELSTLTEGNLLVSWGSVDFYWGWWVWQLYNWFLPFGQFSKMVDVPHYAHKEPAEPLESWNLLAHRGPKKATPKHVLDLCFPTYDRICSWREIFTSPLQYRNSKNLHHQIFRQKTQISQWSSCIHPDISDQKPTKMVWRGTIVLLTICIHTGAI